MTFKKSWYFDVFFLFQHRNIALTEFETIFHRKNYMKLMSCKQKSDFDLPKHIFIHLISNKINISFKYFLNFGRYFHDLNDVFKIIVQNKAELRVPDHGCFLHMENAKARVNISCSVFLLENIFNSFLDIKLQKVLNNNSPDLGYRLHSK